MHDFYCDEVLNGKTPVEKVLETERVLAFHHTRPAYMVHIVVIPKLHIPSLVDFAPGDDSLMLELMGVVRDVARQVLAAHGAARVITNLGEYQESKHLHWHVVSGARLEKS